MEDKRTDISQIKKYLNGELDAKAMHRLEREALNDPFLMDALEGLQNNTGQNNGIADLERRLNERTAKTERRIIPMWYWGVAASILLIVGVSALFYRYNAAPEKETLTAQADKTEVKEPSLTPPDANKPDTAIINQPQAIVYDAGKPKPVVSTKAKLRFEVNPPETAATNTIAKIKPLPEKEAADSTDLSDMIMNGLATQKKSSPEIAETRVAIDTTKKFQVALNGRAQGVQTNPNYNALKQPVIVQGVVIGKDDGLPIPGVNIRVLGTTIGAQTNVNGKFSLSGAADKTISIAALGYQSEQVQLNGKDSLKVALSPSNLSLNEVVVTSGGQQKINQGARPARGWKEFNEYLRNNAKPVNGIEGTVKLQFTVEPNGSISNIKVAKSLNPLSDAAAVKLISEGPVWYGNTNGKAEVVKLKVVFKKS